MQPVLSEYVALVQAELTEAAKLSFIPYIMSKTMGYNMTPIVCGNMFPVLSSTLYTKSG